jgi:quinol monooxygenase YgiN
VALSVWVSQIGRRGVAELIGCAGTEQFETEQPAYAVAVVLALASCASVVRVFALIVRFDLPDAAAAQAFDELTAHAVPLIRANEPGTLVYEPHAVEGEPLSRVFYEVYRDREAHAEHERQPHTMQFLAGVRALVTTTRVELLTPQLPTG